MLSPRDLRGVLCLGRAVFGRAMSWSILNLDLAIGNLDVRLRMTCDMHLRAFAGAGGQEGANLNLAAVHLMTGAWREARNACSKAPHLHSNPTLTSVSALMHQA